ncbi:hypothetical protein EKH57_14300 [Halorubrum sp. BOL3-1]|nr:hypothetical protein EKH57_14300 [Halorubrum sp. BOL3-1]
MDRYHRVERITSWVLALSVAGAFLAAVAAVSFWPGVAVAAVLAVAFRVPVYRRRGSSRLRTEAPPETVLREFESARPPVLAFQWGLADEVRTESVAGTDATYEVSSLFGLRSASIDVTAERRETDSGSAAVDIEGTADGRPWGSYVITVHEADDGRTVVDVELAPTRRFDLRRLPQGWVAERYYADVLAAQGYEVVEREVSHGL